MATSKLIDMAYFPGCSLATTAKESNASLIAYCRRIGVNLIELPDWNCCGSSSAHSLSRQLALDLASRNLAQIPEGLPLLVACPSCTLRLDEARHHLQTHATARTRFEANWNRPFDSGLKIVHFLELLENKTASNNSNGHCQSLNGLKFVPYYGCMLNRPPSIRSEKNLFGLMEKILAQLGAEPMRWSYHSKCCGTFLSVARPDAVVPLVNRIFENAVDTRAKCIVTACAMCHMNLEIRCTRKEKLPVLHFSELLSLAMGAGDHPDWFARHLIDPRPVLTTYGLLG